MSAERRVLCAKPFSPTPGSRLNCPYHRASRRIDRATLRTNEIWRSLARRIHELSLWLPRIWLQALLPLSRLSPLLRRPLRLRRLGLSWRHDRSPYRSAAATLRLSATASSAGSLHDQAVSGWCDRAALQSVRRSASSRCARSGASADASASADAGADSHARTRLMHRRLQQ